MFERHTEKTRRLLLFARFEATASGSDAVESEHLLLGLIREIGSAASEIVGRAGVTAEGVRQEIERRRRPPSVRPPGDIDLSDEVRLILQFAGQEADRLPDREVDSAHVLLGILHAERSVAASILMAQGLRLDSTRNEIVRLRSEPPLQPGVYIVPTTRRSGSGEDRGTDDSWQLEGLDLRGALARISSSGETLFPETRIEVAASLDPGARYDFILRLGPQDDRADRHELMRRGIEAHFGVTVEREKRAMDVYVLTAPHGRHPAIKEVRDEGGGFIGCSSVEFTLTDPGGEPPTAESLRARLRTLELRLEALRAGSVGGASTSNGSMAMFCSTLEHALDRPVVDETGFAGRYDIELSSGPGDLVQRLREELGLALTPDRRPVTWLIVRARPQ